MQKTILFLLVIILAAPVFSQAAPTSRFDDIKIRQYMPGDIVHIIVEAPFDTKEITAVMPDEQRALLSFDSRHNVWHGYWEVPHGFKKGVYTARLLAVDVEGRLFEGQSSQFVVSEPAMTLMVQLAPQKGGVVVPKPSPKPMPTPTPIPSPQPQPQSQEEETGPSRTTIDIPPLEEFIAQTQVEPEPVPLPKPKKKAALPKPKDKSLIMAQLMISAKNYMADQDYVRAKEKLLALLKLNPQNSEIRLMIARLDAIIKANRL